MDRDRAGCPAAGRVRHAEAGDITRSRAHTRTTAVVIRAGAAPGTGAIDTYTGDHTRPYARDPARPPAYAVGHWLFGLIGHTLFAVVVCAGLPTAQNAFIFASEYRLNTDLARDTVILSTVCSMVSLSLITWLLV